MQGKGEIVGKKAPSFSLKTHEGKTFVLEEALKNGPVMLVFYPGDFTLVCTKQLCNYRDSWEKFQELGVQVIAHDRDVAEKIAAGNKSYDP